MLQSTQPQGELAIRTIAMPADTNPSGHIFGGWVVSQMDLAGGLISRKFTNQNVVTVAIEAMEFVAPIYVGDFVCCYADMIKTGRTSIHLNIQTWALTPPNEQRRLVTHGIFVYVAVDKLFKPTAIDVNDGQSKK